jgi:hypothetical protein
MILEQRTYMLNPRFSLQQYLEPYRRLGLPVQISYLGEPIGAFTVDVGDLHSIVGFWRYENHEDRSDRRRRLAQDPKWEECLTIIRPMIHTMRNQILVPLEHSRLC